MRAVTHNRRKLKENNISRVLYVGVGGFHREQL
nr:MAG TPA: hypothetical protein [Caudoviricetes sp.]